MKYLHKYDTKAAHDAVYKGSDYQEPWVAKISATNKVTYNNPYATYAKEYMTTVALNTGTISFTINKNVNTNCIRTISYSTNNGITWNTTQNTDNKSEDILIIVNVKRGDKILWKGDAYSMSAAIDDKCSKFNGTVKFTVEGNIMSLLYEDNFINKDKFVRNCTFCNLFNNTLVINAKKLILPATTLVTCCYYKMFYDCASLTTAPELPATTLDNWCYRDMFNGCMSLILAPELPATTLASNCYSYMFKGCTNLTTAPELPTTTLANNCYQLMFSGCTHLTTAPELPATTLTTSCYSNMFNGCTSLTTAPELPATTLASECYSFMFCNCTNLAKVSELPATTLASHCYSNMFRHCDNLVSAPELPATILATSCYSSMFLDCTSLTTAPELPATTLVNSCYSSMFYGCTKINYIKAMFTTTPSLTYTSNWVYGVASTGTFVKNLEATWNVTGSNGIPSRWTVIYPPIAELYFDDYPNDDEKNIWDDCDDIVARSIEDPDGYGCNKMIYKGQTIEIDGLTYHIWDYDENDSMKILTNTVDPDILTSQSLAANYLEYVDSANNVSEGEQNLVNNITFDSLYGVMMDDNLYKTGYDNTWVQSQRLVKYVKL